MFSRTRCHLFVLGAAPHAVRRGLTQVYRGWGLDESTPAARGHRGTDVHEVRLRAYSGGTAVAVEDPTTLFELSYTLCKTLGDVPVVASRAFKFGDWALKIYDDRDCILKVGADPDSELAWIGRPLEADGIAPMLTRLAAANPLPSPPALEAFLQQVIAGRPDPRDFVDGLGLPALTVGFQEAANEDDWQHLVWSR